ncbi:class I SAM-dependent methyltransferase [Luteimonas fraxinea]|uniref:Class I SAM-dependent methyltransferase n=1 Tax=Luteimonas fraxinea TaxID=2901869 RepID=A0ABS8U9E2_9GAMM|nr:class I SAM-dependent methyltransferase [Luteimonas fraxinea]MCD9096088.1 class I SAM-dependent methyltransferase [Luteimonas fraxinea]MCD9124678.1 class I SAM-dependent methyltransferase [Luteimonas fraxinea]UHH10742.1 class I SAM-dependent methyltransferase [Luteimonas fraxinea]
MKSKKTLIALAICTPFLLACADKAVNAYEPADGNATSAAANEDAMNTTHTVTAAIGPDSPHAEGAPPPSREPDVIYVPTPEPVVDAMLNLAGVKAGDVLYDLGSGDGRIPIAAAQRFGVRGVGIDINPVRVREANANAETAGVTNLVTFKEADLFKEDISEASVVTLYLLQSLNVKLRPKLLAELKPGTRIVSHAFDMADQWEPEQTQEVDGTRIYLWTVPER